MSMYACVVLLAVCVAAVSADSGYDYYRPPLPPCDDCVCRIEAKRQDARTNGIFVPWFNAVFRKDIFPCPPRIPKLPYYTQNYRPPTIRPCTCEEDKKLTVFFCKNQISKLQALPHQKCPCVGTICKKLVAVGRFWTFEATLEAIPKGCVCVPRISGKSRCKVFVSRCQRH